MSLELRPLPHLLAPTYYAANTNAVEFPLHTVLFLTCIPLLMLLHQARPIAFCLANSLALHFTRFCVS